MFPMGIDINIVVHVKSNTEMIAVDMKIAFPCER